MALAANTVIAMGGGIAVVKEGDVTARIAYPVAGVLSTKAPAEVAREHKRVVEAAGEICTWQPPYRTFKALEGQSLACNRRAAPDRPGAHGRRHQGNQRKSGDANSESSSEWRIAASG